MSMVFPLLNNLSIDPHPEINLLGMKEGCAGHVDAFK